MLRLGAWVRLQWAVLPPCWPPPAAWDLLLVGLGVSGAWIGNLTVLEPYRPFFIGAALLALAFAWRRIFRRAQACAPGEVCALPQARTTYKVIFWVVIVLVLVALLFPYVLPLFY
ncbi:Mercuric transport protein MerT [mine drainage metagenome]|uniref:Mercuric transport protein MerT n=1 Tax=mine drainage metagenome TaxID=410659 RepID=T1ARW9_9ZZZZ